MNTLENIGLVILIVVVVLILLTVLIALIMTLRILASLRKISLKAEQTTERFADIAMMVGKRVAPVALTAAVAAAIRRFKSKKE